MRGSKVCSVVCGIILGLLFAASAAGIITAHFFMDQTATELKDLKEKMRNEKDEIDYFQGKLLTL